MSRSSTSSARNLSLTEELEKLEQSITLTLQEIDHNFSRAHRIVTTSILPIVEQYAEHSKAVWEGSKFWKQFFEASANVSLSGYEELATDDTTTTGDETHTTSSSEDAYGANDTTLASNAQTSHHNSSTQEDSPTTLSPDNIHKTPRAPPRVPKPHTTPPTAPSIADYPSPYETLKREIHGISNTPSTSSSYEQPSTPNAQQGALPDMSMTPSRSSPFAPTTSHYAPSTTRKGADPLLHRVLDKNYRLQATPHKTARLPANSNTGTTASKKTPRETGRKWRDSIDLDSSPVDAAPQLHEDIFSSPVRGGRTPGVSVQTPMRRDVGKDTDRGGQSGGMTGGDVGLWDSDSDEEGGMEFSPPKTMQFHVPQSRLLRTPAREASKRIVEDLLLTAGGNVTDDLEESPSVVRRHEGGLEDSF